MLFKYFTDPCGEDGICLVKASCNLKNSYPWNRSEKCPDYEKYRKRRDRKKSIIEWIIGSFSMLVAFICVVFAIVSFCWGAWDLTKAIYNWVF